jgi:hypothetical protein
MNLNITSAKVVYMHVAVRKTQDGDKGRYARTGIRVDFADSDWWFLHFRTGKWTQHTQQLKQIKHEAGHHYVPYKRAYTVAEMQQEFELPILETLNAGVQLALQNELAQRLKFGMERWGGLIPSRPNTVEVAAAAQATAPSIFAAV